MICQLDKKRIEDLETTNILTQTPFWGRIKRNQGLLPLGFEMTVSEDLLYEEADARLKTEDDLLVFTKYIDKNTCYAYVPYGPKLEPSFENQGLFLEHLSEVIKPHLPQQCMFIRYDLMWENQWSREEQYFDDSGNWMGAPDSKTQEFRLNFKTTNWCLKKSVGDILPKNTIFLDLNLTERELFRNMRYNTRYNVQKGFKNGISIKEYGLEYISEWYKLYADTAIRHGMALQNEEFFSNIFTNQDNNKKGVTVKLLMAERNGEFLSSMFLLLSKKRGTYLYGASTSLKNNLMASYALQWESIRISKQWECTEYDMFGTAPNLKKNHPLHGVHIYKKGFGGNLYHRMGCWDYPYNKQFYEAYRLQELKN
ncbi:lipid II:glycine glycyltransferase FemX [Arachidicoccus soli]|uniref:Peptidoglycan bridge formation glycyltransferase FemA/FemB family protein n=1 Tax=Arachidicoccus soli TaxID=2341117 RepID=A0A386HT13_9BACT|nr:peptidoglycan bridge formation glycyltransferase FemA/FemB family protein [Arachidicoccus soli]AYD48424.1 peptidoglycan bridge formation glycyltransferase FemA/FemB family protein [Arachidicoccus soli]